MPRLLPVPVLVMAGLVAANVLPAAARAQDPEARTEQAAAATEEGDPEKKARVKVTEAGGHLVVTTESVDVEAEAPGYGTESTSVATKTDTPLLQVPLNVSVTERQQLDDMQTITISKAHDYSVGFTPRSYDGLAFSRGFDVGWYDHRRDGLRTYAWSIREPVALEKIQYLRGPSGVLYGDGSPGGLVNLVLKKPLPVAAYEVGVAAGNLGFLRATGDATGALSADGRLLYRVIGAAEGLDNESANAERRYTLLPTFSYRFGDATTVTLDGEAYYEGQRGYGQSFAATSTMLKGDLRGAPRGFNVASPDDHWYNWNFSPGLRLDTALGANTSLHVSTRYTQIVADYDYHYIDSLEPDDRTLNRTLYQAYYDWREYQSDSFVSRRVKTGGLRHRVVSGLEAGLSTTDGRWGVGTSDQVDMFDPVYPPRPAEPVDKTPSRDDTRRFGAYVQDQIDVGSRLHLVGAVRFSQVRTRGITPADPGSGSPEVVDEIRSQAWSPRAGIVFQPRPNLSLYGSFTDAFEPAYPGSLLEDGSPVTPARSHSYEAGFKADLLGSRLSFSSALYRIQREDIAEWQPGGFYRQIGEAESQGFEVELVGTLIPGLDVRPGYAYNRTEITRDTSGFTGKALRGAPRHKFNLWAKYTLSQGALRGLAVNTGVVHVGRRFTDSANEIETPAYTRLDAGVSYARGSYVFDVSIENLTDTTYIQSGWDASYWEYGNGRRTSLLVRRKF